VTDVTATLKARIEQLETELTAEQQRSGGHWSQYEHERERADLLARSHEKLDIQLKNLPPASASWTAGYRALNTAPLVALAARDRLMKFPAQQRQPRRAA